MCVVSTGLKPVSTGVKPFYDIVLVKVCIKRYSLLCKFILQCRSSEPWSMYTMLAFGSGQVFFTAYQLELTRGRASYMLTFILLAAVSTRGGKKCSCTGELP